MAPLLPRAVYQMCVHGALLCGSYAKWLTGEELNGFDPEACDFDLLVPLESWQKIALLIPEDARPNKFGGWRFTAEGINQPIYTSDMQKIGDARVDREVDVWPDTVENYLSNCRTKYGGSVKVVDYINNRVFSAHSQALEGPHKNPF